MGLENIHEADTALHAALVGLAVGGLAGFLGSGGDVDGAGEQPNPNSRESEGNVHKLLPCAGA